MDVNSVASAQVAEVTQAVTQAINQEAALAEKLVKIAAQQTISGVGENLDVVR